MPSPMTPIHLLKTVALGLLAARHGAAARPEGEGWRSTRAADLAQSDAAWGWHQVPCPTPSAPPAPRVAAQAAIAAPALNCYRWQLRETQ